MFNTKLNRNILAAAFATLFLYGLAIAPSTAAVRKEPGVTGQSQKADCADRCVISFLRNPTFGGRYKSMWIGAGRKHCNAAYRTHFFACT